MKTFIFAVCMALLANCAYSNQYGQCVGLFQTEDPELNYNISIRNAVWTALSPWTIVTPVIWAFACAKCPTGYKHQVEKTSCRIADDPLYISPNPYG